MRLAIALLTFSALMPLAPAKAADVTVGVAAPLSGSFALLGEQVRQGAETAAANFPGGTVTLDIEDDRCSAEGGAAAANEFVRSGVNVVVGFLCNDAIDAAMPILKKAGITAITPGVRTDSLTDNRKKTGWTVFRMAPRIDDEGAAVGSILTDQWRSVLFAIVDDGTIYGRGLADILRASAEQRGMKPAFVDTYRPGMDNQVGLAFRLRRAGVNHVFVGGARDDIAIIARDAAKIHLKLEIAGGEALRAPEGDVPLAAGTLMIAPPDWTNPVDPAVAEQLKKAEIAPEGYVLPAYAALQVGASAASEAAEGGKKVIDILSNETFQTAIGPIRFDDKGDLAQNPYRLFRYDGNAFVDVKR
ncbi:MAG: ABC transporter substrate-binding protein [Rhizobiaceae bacterium]|nr:MAG: ABC transporter substrate-binding protein [Rhizobiaceae bacterium]